MPALTLSVAATPAAQALGAVLLAALLRHVHGGYRRAYLRHWAASWCAFAVHLWCAGQGPAAGGPPGRVLDAVGTAAALLQVLWLVQGAWELSRGREVEPALVRPLLPVALAVAAAATLGDAFGPAAGGARAVLGMAARPEAVAAAFLAAAVLAWRARTDGGRSGPRLVAAAFAAYGLEPVLVPGAPVSGPLPAWMMGLGMVVCLLEDERAWARRAEAQAEHLAGHDALTGLPSRRLFLDRVESALRQARREGGGVAVVFLDVDRFKRINDSLGHAAGDALLRELARRLGAAVREGGALARVGGDEFVLLVPGVRRAAEAVRTARDALDAVRLPVMVEGRELRVTASAGIALSPGDGEDAEGLVQKADAAMFGAKEAGRDRLGHRGGAVAARAAELLALESALRRGVERGELLLHYQPILDARTGRVHGTEALVRWSHPERGLLYPAGFIRLAEEAGLAHRIGVQVLHAACAQTARWQRAGAEGLSVAVNLSAGHFADPRLVDEVARALEAAGLEPRFLELEITESLALDPAGAAPRTLRALKALGVRISIDDFGTGYSSLSYLKRFPVDTLKVDRSLVAGIHRDRGDEAIVATVMGLARLLGLGVVAEGVENEAQLALVREHGCDRVQGYLLGRPAPPEEVAALVLSRAGEPALELRAS